MPKLSEIAAVIEDHCAEYTLIEIHAARRVIICAIEHTGPGDLSAQAKFGLSMMELELADDWRLMVQHQARQAVADLDRFLRGSLQGNAHDVSHETAPAG